MAAAAAAAAWLLLIAMYGRSTSINSVGGGGGGSDDGAHHRDKGGSGGRGRAKSSSIGSSTSSGGCDSSPSSSSLSSVETGPRSSRDVRRSISSNNNGNNNGNNSNNNSSCSSVDSRLFSPRSLGPSEVYDQNILKNRASVLSQLSSVFGQRVNSGGGGSSRSNSLVPVKQQEVQIPDSLDCVIIGILSVYSRNYLEKSGLYLLKCFVT